MAKPKIFVLDTNIPLHDYKSIRHFQDNDLVIPIAVIEELDKFKKGNDTLSFNARGFLRELDKITDGRLFGKDGVPIGPKLGNIKIEPNHPFPDQLKDLFLDDIQDHRILATAIWVRDQHPDRFTALVTKDINLGGTGRYPRRCSPETGLWLRYRHRLEAHCPKGAQTQPII